MFSFHNRGWFLHVVERYIYFTTLALSGSLKPQTGEEGTVGDSNLSKLFDCVLFFPDSKGPSLFTFSLLYLSVPLIFKATREKACRTDRWVRQT